MLLCLRLRYPLSKDTLNSRFLLSGYSPDTNTSKYPLRHLSPPTLQNCPRISPPSSQVSQETRETPRKNTATRARKNHPSFNAERNYPCQESENHPAPLERGDARKSKNPRQKSTRNLERNYSELEKERKRGRKIEGRGGKIEAEKRIPVGGGD